MKPAWLDRPVRALDGSAHDEALEHQAQLTKPPGSLGRLEEVAVRLAAMQRTSRPELERVRIVVFAADHGVAVERVSAFPQAVTVEMIRNFSRGGAAICVLARELNAELEVVDVGAATDPGPLPGVLSRRVAAGTANFRERPAMDEAQLTAALEVGREAAERALEAGCQMFIGGDMGIANTTAAAALACGLTGEEPGSLAGPGTGLDADGVSHKVAVLRDVLERHRHACDDPYQALRCLGGLEIAALCGAYIACAQLGLPVLVDGFIASSAALAAVGIRPDVRDWLIYSHASAEPGHQRIMQALEARPLLDLGMRLGEGSGAATALPLLRLACALHKGMATFAEAGVSEKEV